MATRLPPRTPVLIGAGAAAQHFQDPLRGADAMGLLRHALAAAAADAGGGGSLLLDRVDEIIVPEGTWTTPDPGRVVLDGRSPGARSVVANVGVLQQSLFTRAAAAISEGRAEVVVVGGTEAKFRALRGQITGAVLPAEPSCPTRPDVLLEPSVLVISDLEIHRRFAPPTHQYAVMESALRHRAGRSPEDHALRVATLVSAMSSVATGNPDAWNPSPLTADEVLAAAMVAQPYTKPCCSQWNVDQAAAFILCSVEAAEAANVPRELWVFPVAGAESNLIVPLTERRDLDRSPAAGAVGRALAELGGRPLAEVELREIYSCFPAAVQIQCNEFGLDLDPNNPPTLTGGMHFAGGPLNSFSLQALVRIVTLLRDQPEATALVSSISGMVTKVGGGIWSATPPSTGFRHADVTETAAATTATLPVDPDHVGTATIAGFTVGHQGGTAIEAVVVAETGEGDRVLASTTDPTLIAALQQGEWCGRTATVHAADLIDLDR